MIKEITLARCDSGQYGTNRYCHSHIMFIANYANIAGIKVNFEISSKILSNQWPVSFLIDGKQVLMDFRDTNNHFDRKVCGYPDIMPMLKWHYETKLHSHIKNMFPVGPMLSHPEGVRGEIVRLLFNTEQCTYKGNTILSLQRAYGDATERRNRVSKILKNNFGNTAMVMADVNRQLPRSEYWKLQRDSLCTVCVPGQRNNMLDRGHYESMVLGACVISPRIDTVLPWNKKLIDGETAIFCKDDYSDLVEKIEWCQSHRKECAEIGGNARKLFFDYCQPTRYFEWIEKCLQST